MFCKANPIYECLRRNGIYEMYFIIYHIEALKIAIEAKLKKKMMLQKPEERHHTTMRGF